MVSKKKPAKVPSVLSASRDLVPVGPRHVEISTRGGKRDNNGLKPTTSRALVIRDGKYGAQGTGELVLVSKLSGREKFDLLAEDLVRQHTQSAVMSPLKLDKCIRIADSQLNSYLDDITSLQDPDTFHRKITEELNARTPCGMTRNGKVVRSDPSYVASTIAIRIHNTYMIASAWRIVLDSLRALEKSGLRDAMAHIQLQKNQDLLSRYLFVCDFVSTLVDLGQKKFSVLATTTPHYARYFKETTNSGEPKIAFDWAGIKDACKSFLDSIIIELCFPKQPYPMRILYHILHDAVEESPREAKRFPQTLWDAVGELSVVLELQELLESPLSGAGEKMKQTPRKMPEQYEQWLDAQTYSQQASDNCANFKDLAFPLQRTEDRAVLEDIWKHVNLNYKAVSNMSIDTLWKLDEALHRVPQWSAFYAPVVANYDSESDGGDSSSLVKRQVRKRLGKHKRPPKKMLAITDGLADDSDGSMPELQSVSDSSDESDDDSVDADQNFDYENVGTDDEYDTESESGYDTEEEDQYRGMLREAMDTAMAIPEFFEAKTPVPEFEAIAEERKGNPFLKLLGSLRGRMFTSSAMLSSTTRAEPRKGLFSAKSAPKPKPAPALKVDFSGIPDDELPPLRPLSVPRKKLAHKTLQAAASPPTQPKDTRTTIEEVDDEDDADSASASKKKKKKKPKKKRAGYPDMDLSVLPEDVTVPPALAPTSPVMSPGHGASPTLTPSEVCSSRKDSLTNSGSSTLVNMSTVSLPLTAQTTAQSGRSYMQEVTLKEKIKTRPDHASMFNRGFLSRSKEQNKEKEKEGDNANPKHTWYSKLSKKTTGYMHQLLRTRNDEKQGGMKWENFLKVMREMGFEYDPSTAGSSVRFDPPGKGDRSITFHKPHPDPTIHPIKLKEYGKKLKEYYGWDEADFMRRTTAAIT